MEFLDQLGNFLEADQTKMTEKQLERDVRNRAHQARVGFEIELYSSMDDPQADAHIKSEVDKYPLLSKNSEVKDDGSLPPSDYLVDQNTRNDEFYDNPLSYLIDYTSVDYYDIATNVLSGDEDLEYYTSKYEEFDEMKDEVMSTFKRIIEELKNMGSRLTGEDDVNEIISEIESSISDIEDLSLNDVVSGDSTLDDAMTEGFDAINNAESNEISQYAKILRELTTDIDIDENDYYNGMYMESEEYESYVDSHDRYYLNNRLIEYYEDDYGFEGGSEYDLEGHEFNGSSGKYGIEIITVTPVHINQAYAYIKELSAACNDEDMENESTYVHADSRYGNTGLHIHFGLTKGVQHTFADILRVYLNTYEKLDEIMELAGRPFTHYSKNIQNVIMAFGRAFAGGQDLSSLVYKLTVEYDYRYYGINLFNLRNNTKKNTIEFRWATSEICFDEASFKAYFDILADIVTKSFTGSPEVEFGQYTIKDVSQTPSSVSVVVMKDGKAIRKVNNIPIGGLMSERVSSRLGRLKTLERQIEMSDTAETKNLYMDEYKSLLAKIKGKR